MIERSAVAEPKFHGLIIDLVIRKGDFQVQDSWMNRLRSGAIEQYEN